MKATRNLVLILGAILLLTPGLYAGDSFSKVGTSGAQFLKLGVGARYTALGDAAVAAVSDGYAMYFNPAALGALDKSHLEFTNIQWIDGVNLNYFSFAKPTGFGSIGVSVTALSSGDIEVTTTEQPNGTGEYYSASSYAIAAGYARRLTDFFSVGVNAKYITEKISEERASGIAFDFGTLLYTGYKSLRIGMSISNLGPEMSFTGPELNFNYNPAPNNESYDPAQGVLSVDSYDLPLMFRIGVAYDIQYSEDTRMTLVLETRDPTDNEQQGAIGTELALGETFFLRGGWKFNCAEENLTLGGGINLAVWEATDLALNYAWADFGRLSSVHRFSLGFRF
ncbi:MAG: PorV/PorQ family protein [candidate division Zixibacteria bacterium]|nr:PorV/PorQ family protein [candidate division Zixibacteria bacterium]